jgi:hypothetical protein
MTPTPARIHINFQPKRALNRDFAGLRSSFFLYNDCGVKAHLAQVAHPEATDTYYKVRKSVEAT